LTDVQVVRRLLAMARARWRWLLAGVAAGFLCNGAAVGLIATSGWLISRASQRPPILSLTMAIVAVRGFGISRGALRYVERLVTHDAGFRLLADTRVGLYRALEPLAPGGLARDRSGDLLRRLVGDVDRLQMLYTRVLVPPFATALTILLAATIAAVILPIAGLVAAAGMLIAAVGVPWLTSRLAGGGAAETAARRGELHAAVVDLVQAMPDLIAFGAAQAQLERIAALDADLCRRARRQATVSALGGATTLFVCGLTVWATLLVAIPAVNAGTIDGTLLAVLALTPFAAFEPIGLVAAAFAELRDGLGSARRVIDVLERVPPIADPASPAACPEDTTIRLEGAGVVYDGRDRPALDALDGLVRPGSRIVVTGASGSGKTTLARALLRFVPVTSGRITLGGIPIDAMAQADVRRRIGLCEDEPRLFATSIRENLRLARPDAGDEELRAAARRARLLDWIEALPDGWDTRVGERGALVSGGQRRRLALARALLARFPVLVLDEPTASLDAATARAVMHDLLAATEGRTTIVITHDLEALEGADEVWRLEGGRLVSRAVRGQVVRTPTAAPTP
jgi:thiol reductant ABC exporter CydC subunit